MFIENLSKKKEGDGKKKRGDGKKKRGDGNRKKIERESSLN